MIIKVLLLSGTNAENIIRYFLKKTALVAVFTNNAKVIDKAQNLWSRILFYQPIRTEGSTKN
jgi:hypothetical protein